MEQEFDVDDSGATKHVVEPHDADEVLLASLLLLATSTLPPGFAL